jgi:hypothetical protein
MRSSNAFYQNTFIDTFKDNNIKIEIFGTVEEPMFKAADIGRILEMGLNS